MRRQYFPAQVSLTFTGLNVKIKGHKLEFKYSHQKKKKKEQKLIIFKLLFEF